MNKFQQRKKDVLSKKDKSSIGSWDKKIFDLCEKINSFEEYCTTSSCSGRIVVMKDEEKKRPGLFEFVSHEVVGIKELLGKISSLWLEDIGSLESGQVQDFSLGGVVKEEGSIYKGDKLCGELVVNSKSSKRKKLTGSVLKQELDLKFKQEPPILHVACKDLKDAETILNLGREAGWKKSGILSLGKNIIVELNCSWKLEFPIVRRGKLLVERGFIKEVLIKANGNLKRGWEKIERLEGKIQKLKEGNF